MYLVHPQIKFPWRRLQKQNPIQWKDLREQIQQVLSYFSTYSPSEMRYLSCRGINYCILCRRYLPPGIGTTVILIFASLSFWKRWRWPDRNFLRCKKWWKSLGARSGLQGGWWLNTSQLNSFRRRDDRRAMCGHRPGTANDEFRAFKSFIIVRTSQSPPYIYIYIYI